MDVSAMTNLSDETFKSVTDQVESSSSFSFSGRQQPWPYAPGNKLESEKQTTSLKHQDRQSELSDFKNNENKLSRKWIDCLKSKETNSRQYQLNTKVQAEIIQVSDEEMNALQSFCNIKINLIHHRVNSKKTKSSRHKKLQLQSNAEDSEIDALDCTVPDELLNRIYLKNMRTAPKQVAAAKQHISSQCPNCNRKRAELAQSAFLRQKRTILESFLLQEKIDEHLHTKDFLTYIGEAHKGLPRLSDDPRLIWKRLIEKSQVRYSGFEKSDAEQKMQLDGNNACHSPFFLGNFSDPFN
ncbi:uncharacterized protein C8orf48 homolog [Choloepus didactylus]|uniref:uncharacterized protein C8orf48 homolog n=1 Tax=Choloepus didactylus TaxID=27675 RepID=UPI00189C688C|nr:uncharacterized protein C8orf48 homolog [Choloepus didactylus]